MYAEGSHETGLVRTHFTDACHGWHSRARVIGLYLNPPEHALVLCVDEKSQIQALDRTQPGLAMKRRRDVAGP
jgi:hypothetical protein